MRHQSSNHSASHFGKEWNHRLTPRMVTLLSALLLVIMGASSALVLADEKAVPQMHFTWQGPSTGTPAVHYVAQVLVNERDTLILGPLTATEVTIDAEYGNKYRIRVAAVDADGIQGPMSLWSDPHSPELGPPSF